MFGFGKTKINLVASFDGAVVPVSEVPDEVFAGGLLGQGYALVPAPEQQTTEVAAPADGTIVQMFETGHAFAIKTTQGLEVLVHIGLDTVELKGEGFAKLKKVGDRVQAGETVIVMDTEKVRQAGKNPVTPVVFTNAKQVSTVKITEGNARGNARVCTVTMS